MKKKWNIAAALGCLGLLSACDTTSSKKSQLPEVVSSNEQQQEVVSGELSDTQKLSRTFGHLLARQLIKSDDIVMDIAEVVKGLQGELECQTAPLTDTEYEEKMLEIQKMLFDKKAQENLSLAEQFLKENKEKAGVVEVQPDKLQYSIVKEGFGRVLSGKPSALLHYKGTFIDGKVFSSSEQNKEPILLPLNQTIPGFALGMQGMKEGETRIIYIHPELAYGTSGQLPPNSLLIFEIKLIEAVDDTAALPEESVEEQVTTVARQEQVEQTVEQVAQPEQSVQQEQA